MTLLAAQVIGLRCPPHGAPPWQERVTGTTPRVIRYLGPKVLRPPYAAQAVKLEKGRAISR